MATKSFIAKRARVWACPKYIRTFSGRAFPVRPKPEDVCIEDVAHGLSITPRWGAQSRYRYPVAAHAIYVASIVPPAYRFAALNHDDSEAYMCDLPKPFKDQMPQYSEIEHGLMEAIAEKFGFNWPLSAVIKAADAVALYQERKAFFNYPISGDVPQARLPKGCKLPQWDFTYWAYATPEEVERRFLEAFELYRPKTNFDRIIAAGLAIAA